ncbi:unnamed protein product [Ilex paraguariensis]|uniref:RNase H type-1 domain-containing protein n=1 Tax=Ilex paraguariensis TaxID=185542 RepID=A0ABC8UR47_9AQUA
MVETDSYTLFQMVRGLAAVPWKMQYLLERIKLLFNFLNLQIKHIYREANGLADFFASFAVKSEQEANGLADFFASFAVKSEQYTEFSATNILPSIGRLIMQQDLYGFPSARLKRLICEQREESRAVLQFLLAAPFPICLDYLLDFFCELLSVDDQAFNIKPGSADDIKGKELLKSSLSDKNPGMNLSSSAVCVGNQSSMPLTLPLVSQSIHFPQISQEPGVSHRSSNHPISRSSSLPQINFFGQDSSGIQYPLSIQSSLVPQTSLDPHLPVSRQSSIANVPSADSGNSSMGNGLLTSALPVPRQSSIANVPLVDSGNSSLGNGLLTSTGIPKPAKRVVYNNGEPGMKKRIAKGDEEKGNGQNVEVNQQKEINIQSGVDHVVINIADKGKGIVQTMPGGNQKQAFKRKEVVHKPEIGNRFSALAFEE